MDNEACGVLRVNLQHRPFSVYRWFYQLFDSRTCEAGRCHEEKRLQNPPTCPDWERPPGPFPLSLEGRSASRGEHALGGVEPLEPLIDLQNGDLHKGGSRSASGSAADGACAPGLGRVAPPTGRQAISSVLPGWHLSPQGDSSIHSHSLLPVPAAALPSSAAAAAAAAQGRLRGYRRRCPRTPAAEAGSCVLRQPDQIQSAAPGGCSKDHSPCRQDRSEAGPPAAGSCVPRRPEQIQSAAPGGCSHDPGPGPSGPCRQDRSEAGPPAAGSCVLRRPDQIQSAAPGGCSHDPGPGPSGPCRQDRSEAGPPAAGS